MARLSLTLKFNSTLKLPSTMVLNIPTFYNLLLQEMKAHGLAMFAATSSGKKLEMSAI